MSSNETTTTSVYPRLLRRVQAALIDSVVITIAFIAGLTLVAQLNFTSLIVNGIIWILPILLLEPGLVAWTGGSIGHHFRGIRVRKLDKDKNLNVFQAVIRFLLKTLFGWLSLIFVLTTKKHQAIHDIYSLSLVVVKHAKSLSHNETYPERIVEEPGFIYPGKTRRVMTAIGYIVIMTIFYLLVILFINQVKCTPTCTEIIGVFIYLSSYAWIWFVGAITVLGWLGKLPGCRRKSINNEN